MSGAMSGGGKGQPKPMTKPELQSFQAKLVDLLKEKKKMMKQSEIMKILDPKRAFPMEIIEYLKQEPSIQIHADGQMEYRSAIERSEEYSHRKLENRDDILNFIQEFPNGVSKVDIEDAYLDAAKDTSQLLSMDIKTIHQIQNTETKIIMLYPNPELEYIWKPSDIVKTMWKNEKLDAQDVKNIKVKMIQSTNEAKSSGSVGFNSSNTIKRRKITN
jgi:hypothetical protein